MTHTDRRLKTFSYEPQNFRDVAETDFGHALLAWLTHRDNVIRMETASYLERAAVEPLGPHLVQHFGAEIAEDRMKQFIGHMVRQIMEHLGYELAQPGMRIAKGLFTTGARYQLPADSRDRSMRITPEQRQAWLQKTAESPFNVWLNSQVRNERGQLDLEKLYAVARRHGVERPERYERLNPGQQRMTLGLQLRSRVKPEEYEATTAQSDQPQSKGG